MLRPRATHKKIAKYLFRPGAMKHKIGRTYFIQRATITKNMLCAPLQPIPVGCGCQLCVGYQFAIINRQLPIIHYICTKQKILKMDITRVKESIERIENLSSTLGMEFLSTPEPDTCMARMKVDERNRQPFGFLSGGASLALAENLAGVASLALCPGKISVGINVSGSHLIAVEQGDTVTALARLMHKGRTLHQWLVEIRNEAGALVCSVQVTNYVLNARKDD